MIYSFNLEITFNVYLRYKFFKLKNGPLLLQIKIFYKINIFKNQDF